MITATFKPGKFVIEGHANYDEHGKDIVCAGVSSLVFAFLECAGAADTQIDTGYTECVHSEDDDMLPYLEMLIRGLQLIEDQYPDHLEVLVWT